MIYGLSLWITSYGLRLVALAHVLEFGAFMVYGLISELELID